VSSWRGLLSRFLVAKISDWWGVGRMEGLRLLDVGVGHFLYSVADVGVWSLMLWSTKEFVFGQGTTL